MYSNFFPELINPAISERMALLESNCLSRPITESKLAVIVSSAVNNGQCSPAEAKKLADEGRAILRACLEQGRQVIDVWSPTATDMDAVLRDSTITDLCVIGEGSLGNVYVLNDADDVNSGIAYDWLAVTKGANHLKTGSIYQRMCSVVGFSPVAWGTFASADLKNIWISELPHFVPEEIHSNPETGLITVYDENVLSYESLEKVANILRQR